MNDRTAILISAILHIGLLSYFIISPRAHYLVPQGGGGIGLAISMPGGPPALPQSMAQIPKPEPPKPEPPKPQPKEEIKPEKPKPILSDETIRELQDKIKKPTPQKPVNTRTPQPTPKPVVKTTPTRMPTPTRTPIPTINNLVPLDQITSGNPSSNPSAITKSATGISKAIGPSVGGPNASGVGTGGPGLGGKGGGGLFIEGTPGYDFTGYGNIINLFLSRNWRPPSIRPPENRDYTALVGFTIFKEGTISNIHIIESSGWIVMDQTVEEAVQRSNPIEPLPASYTSDNIQVRVPFVLQQK